MRALQEISDAERTQMKAEAREQARERQTATMLRAARSAAICGCCGRLLAPTDSVTMEWHNFGRRRNPHWKRVPVCLLCTLGEMKPVSWLDTDHPTYLSGGYIARVRCLTCNRRMRIKRSSNDFRPLSRNAQCCCDDCRREMRNEPNRVRRRVKHKSVMCRMCGNFFMPKRADAVTCSNRCRQALHRRARLSLAASDIRNDQTLTQRGVEATLRVTADGRQRVRRRIERT